MALISSKMLTEFASPSETSDMLMSFMKGVLGEHIGESDDVRKIVLATVTAWKDSSTQRYLKGIVDTINAIHRDERGGRRRRGAPIARAPHFGGAPRDATAEAGAARRRAHALGVHAAEDEPVRKSEYLESRVSSLSSLESLSTSSSRAFSRNAFVSRAVCISALKLT
jgi:hypothetical protein